MLGDVGLHWDFCCDVTAAGGCSVLANYCDTESFRTVFSTCKMSFFRRPVSLQIIMQSLFTSCAGAGVWRYLSLIRHRMLTHHVFYSKAERPLSQELYQLITQCFMTSRQCIHQACVSYSDHSRQGMRTTTGL
jgi:hypothetical protein